MGARQTNRSPRGVQAEAKRRLADRMAKAESALADYLEASEQIDYARQLIVSYEGHQQRALVSLIDAIGREQAADLAGVDERQIRAALSAQTRMPAGETMPDDRRPEPERPVEAEVTEPMAGDEPEEPAQGEEAQEPTPEGKQPQLTAVDGS